jgi:heat shock protein HslJ
MGILYFAFMKKLIYLSTALLLMLACKHNNTIQNNNAAHPTDIKNTLQGTWSLTWMQNIDHDTIDFAAGMPFLTFSTKDSSVVGFTGCNNLNATYTSGAENTLTFGLLATSKRYCYGIPENIFLDQLTKTSGFKRNGESLSFMAEGAEVLRFKKLN